MAHKDVANVRIYFFLSSLFMLFYSPLSLPSASSSSATPRLAPPFPPNMAAEKLPVEHLNLLLCALGRKLAALPREALTSGLE